MSEAPDNFRKAQKPGTVRDGGKIPTQSFRRPGGASSVEDGYGVFVNASTGEEKNFGNTRPPPGWVKKGAVNLNVPDGPAGAGGAGGLEWGFVDPFLVAAQTAEFNADAVPKLLRFSTDAGFELASQGTEANVRAFLGGVDRIFPGYSKILSGMEKQTAAFLRGELPQETKDLLYREAAERGVTRGVFGQRAQYEGLTSIRDRQLQVMELGFNQGAAIRQQTDALMQSLIVNPVSVTQELFARSLPLFTLSVDSANNVMLANSEGALKGAIAEGQLGLGYAQLALEEQKFAWSQAEAERQRRAAERSSRFGFLGTLGGGVLGAALAPFTGGLSLAASAGIGASLGGALGSAAAGNYAGASYGLGTALSSYGTFSAMQDFTAALRTPVRPTGGPLRPVTPPYDYSRPYSLSPVDTYYPRF